MKKKTILLLTATLLVGFALGFLSSVLLSRDRLHRYARTHTKQGFERRFTEMLQPEGQEALGAVISDYAEQHAGLSKAHRKNRRELMKRFFEEAAPLLTPEQQQQLDAYKARLKKRARCRLDKK